LVEQVLRDERRILREIDWALTTRPGARPRLATARSIVVTHIEWLANLRGSKNDRSSSTTSLSTSGDATTGTSSTGPAPPDQHAAVRLVSNLCSRAADSRLRECVSAESGPLAQLLASMSASYVVLVEGLRAR
jgi:hypothetical protein